MVLNGKEIKLNALYLISWVIFSTVLLIFTLLRSHPYRFTRFLAFESLLGIIFLNAAAWFRNPLSFQQIISWLFLIGSLFLALHGFYLLRYKGNPAGDFEDTTTLIRTGAFRYIRHPLYTSLILFGLGGFLKNPSTLGGILLAILNLGVFLTARIEEKHNLERFGEDYRRYCNETKRFIPFLI
jgi:protein-S-isoprenylcysteine O-methyltransferase Ste14